MPSQVCRWLLLLVTIAGCAPAAPPFGELPLRDALRADPEVVAALPDGERGRLAARFQAAAAADTAADAVDQAGTLEGLLGAPATTPPGDAQLRQGETAGAPAALVDGLDRARQRRSADALVIGVVAGGEAQALPAGTQAGAVDAAALPPIDGGVAAATADLEARALAGAAGASLRELLAASHARRIERVVGWPAAAVTVGDTVYVNGAWLVAMAPAGDGGAACEVGWCDGGAAACDAGPRDGGAAACDAGPRDGGGRGQAGPVRPSVDVDFANDGTGGSRGWTSTTTTTSIGGGSTTDDLNIAGAAADSCAALADACASTDDGSDDSCGGGDDDSQDACSAPPDDGSDADCAAAPGRGRTPAATIVWMFAPLVYLWGRQR